MDDIHAALIGLPELWRPIMLCDLYVASVEHNSEDLHERLVNYNFYRLPTMWRVVCLAKIMEIEEIRYSIMASSTETQFPGLHGLLNMFHKTDLEELFSTLISRSLKNPDNVSKSTLVAPLKLMRNVYSERGLGDSKAINIALKAFYQHMWNEELTSTFVDSLNSLFPEGHPDVEIFAEASDFKKLAKLNGFNNSLDTYLSVVDTKPFTSRHGSVLLGNLTLHPEICLYAIDRNLHKIITSGDDNLISSLLHGHWLDNADEKIISHGRAIIHKIISSPMFNAANDLSKVSTFCGTLASVVSCAKLKELGENVKKPSSKYGEESVACHSAASHLTKITDAEISSTNSIIMSMSTASIFADIYEAFVEKGAKIKRASSKMEQVQIVAALALAEKHAGGFVDDELSVSNIVYERHELGDPLLQVEGFCSIAMHGMTQEQLINVAPESDYYLKMLITSELIDKSHMSKLSAIARKSIVSNDLDL